MGKGEVFDVTVPSTESFYANGVINHNTTMACIEQTYKIYILSCMKSPQKMLGLAEGTILVFYLFNLTLQKSELSLLKPFYNVLSQNCYFSKQFPEQADDKELFTDKIKEVSFPFGVHVLQGSSVSHAISENAISAILDEQAHRDTKAFVDSKNEYNEDSKAFQLYSSVSSRLTSRSIGLRSVGVLCNIGSGYTGTSFLDVHEKNIRGKKGVHFSTFKLWDVKPPNQFPSKRFFRVDVGDDARMPKILEENEVSTIPDAEILDVPVELKNEFELNLVTSLRNLAGISHQGENPLITARYKIRECIDPNRQHPFDRTVIEMGMNDETRIQDYLDVRSLCVEYAKDQFRPKIRPGVRRAIGIDIGVKNDCYGITLGHISGRKDLIGSDIDGTLREVSSPIFEIDLMVRVKAPEGDRVDLAKAREFLIFLTRKMEYPIHVISGDSYMKEDNVQLLEKTKLFQHIETLSVDRDDVPYTLLERSIVETRVNYYEFTPILDELTALLRIDGKVDHPPGGSKDNADSLCQCVNQLAIYDKEISADQGFIFEVEPPKPKDNWLTGDYNHTRKTGFFK